MSRQGNGYNNAVMKAFCSDAKGERADRFGSYGEAKLELFDCFEAFYNQQSRPSTLGQISPPDFERRANEERVDHLEQRPERDVPQAPHPSSVSMKEEKITRTNQLSDTVSLNRPGPSRRTVPSNAGWFVQDES